MPVYEYHCDTNGKTVEVNHTIGIRIRTWGELCYAAQIELGNIDPLAPVRRIITKAPAVAVTVSNSELKNHGFTKLVKRDDGIYENVTASGDEQRYMKRGEAETMPHVKKKIRD